MTARIKLLIALCRPPVLLLLVLYTAIGLASAGHHDDPLLAARVLVPIAACQLFSVACNDLCDEAIDRVNLPGDRQRPLVGAGSGAALRREMVVVMAAAAVVCVGGALMLGPRPTAVAVAGLLLGGAYSLRPVRLVERGLWAASALAACFVVVPFLLGRLTVGPHLTGRDAAMLTGLSVGFVGRILLKDFRDVRGDALFGKRTFLVRRGRARTCLVSAVCWTFGCTVMAAATPRPTTAYLVAAVVQSAGALWLLVPAAARALAAFKVFGLLRDRPRPPLLIRVSHRAGGTAADRGHPRCRVPGRRFGHDGQAHQVCLPRSAGAGSTLSAWSPSCRPGTSTVHQRGALSSASQETQLSLRS